MAELTYRDAVAAGIAQEMKRDENVVFLGEDVAAAGKQGADGGGVAVVLAEIAVTQIGVRVEVQNDEVLIALRKRADRSGRDRVLAETA